MFSNLFKSIFKGDKDAASLSLPNKKILRGIKIEKLPIGRYIEAINSLKNLPETLLKESFPGLTPDQVLEKLKKMDEDLLLELAGNLLKTVPDQLLKFIAELLKCDYGYLYNNVSPKEMLEVLSEFWKLNDMSDFIKTLKGLVMKAKTLP